MFDLQKKQLRERIEGKLGTEEGAVITEADLILILKALS